MTLRSRLAAAPVPVAKVFGPGVPPAIEAAEARAQMTPASPFSPGEPIGPYDGFSRTPRSRDFVTGYNISARPRSHERVSFETLRSLIDSYDVASIAIWHRIDTIRALDWKLVAADHVDGDVSDAVKTGMEALESPDRENTFDGWLAKWLWDVLAYDAGCLSRMRNRAGKAVGLQVVDGTTIAPLLDYWGNRPKPPAEAFVQYVNGLPWNWLTEDDLIYQPFRPRSNSPYGQAPLETVLLNANTDIRFQLYFLQRFTSGNLPAAFAGAPESWTPDQIEQFQEYWDAFMLADQERKHQIRWIPGGSSFAWSDEKEFTDTFSLFLMRKTLAAFHVVPADVGFTENVNKSSGESQADVSHKVGEAPLVRYVQRILTRYVQQDLGLPLKHSFDLGEEQADRVQQAQADKIYVDMGAISPSTVGEMRYGNTDPVTIPRYIMTSRGGPVPVSSLMAVAGEIDQATGLPAPGAPLPKNVFGGAEGVLPEPPIKVVPLAEREFGPSAMPPAPPPQPVLGDNGQVAKEGEGAPGAGITAETGVYSYDLAGLDEDDEAVAKEMAAFRRFARARRRAGEWRDFEFRSAGPVTAHRLNDAGRLAVRKAAGEIAVAGLAVLAADTGRVLMLQRALAGDDPAAGTWEFPGGHLEGDESPLAAAWREWQEETGAPCAPGVQTGTWASGIYQGIVWTIERESMVPVRSDCVIANPDDPDGDCAESIAWWDPLMLPGNPAVRPELLADIGAVMAALGCEPEEVTAAKAATPVPKDWPGWKLDLRAASHWAPKVTAAAQQALSREHLDAIASGYISDHPGQDGKAAGKRERNAAALAWLLARRTSVPMGGVADGITLDGAMIGAASAQAAASGQDDADTGAWQPGNAAAARAVIEALGVTAVLGLLGEGEGGGGAPDIAGAMEGGYLNVVARVLAGWDPETAAAELSDMLETAVADGAYAEALTATQIEIVSGNAALQWYAGSNVALLQWYAGPGACQICLANAAADPRPPGVLWPGGVAEPLQHPSCGCYLAPPQ